MPIMFYSGRRKAFIVFIFLFTFISAVAIGIGIGFFLSTSKNTNVRDDLSDYKPALPTQVLDRNGELITEIFSNEKRDIVPIQDLPKTLIYALITREDDNFFKHYGFSFRGTFRAAWHILLNKLGSSSGYSSGGSTLTQQVAGKHYANRKDITIKRKLKELWYSFQFERTMSKYEILQRYMNEMYFGHNAYGVEAASEFYFGHPAKDITLAEAAILVIQLASPAFYSPINHPDRAKARQIDVLNQMVKLGYATRKQADLSLQQYWDSYNYTRSNIASAYFDNNSKAPYFSEYVRIKLNDMLYGAVNINKDGYIVHTTLDLGYQKIADKIMDKAFHSINQRYKNKSDKRLDIVDTSYVPIVEMLGLTFNLPDIQVSGARQKKASRKDFYSELNPTLSVVSMMLGIKDINDMAQLADSKDQQSAKKTTVEGALVTIDDHTGQILAMVGGSDYETKKYNRAVDAHVQPGSSFKPLYYSAAISSRKLTAATRLYDGPIIFYDDNGKAYTPTNYLGRWHGSVLLRYALAHSMNVPSLQVLQKVGFEAAIDRASKMLGEYDQRENRKLFPRGFPLGLGVTSVSPLKMARAFATFPNHGKEVVPIAITSVLDRTGNVILNPEKVRLRESQNRKNDNQIMTPQVAYIMVNMLQSTVKYGTLKWPRIRVGGFDGMPMAGKTGTTQNWGDAWTVGFSPYYTTAIWFGFDTPGNSLGRELTGSTATGPVWAEYMKEINRGLPRIKFDKPETGLVEQKVCAVSGKLPTKYCDDGLVDEIFLAGTEPKEFCKIHTYRKNREESLINKLQDTLTIENFGIDTYDSGNLPDLNKTNNTDNMQKQNTNPLLE